MKLSAPRFVVWLLAFILAGLAIASKYVGIPYIGDFVKQYDFWFLVAAYGLLFLGTMFRGL